MRLRTIPASLVAMSLLAAATFSSARAIDLGYGGRLAQEDGSPLAGPLDVTLRFFASPTGADQLGSSLSYSAVALNDGVFQLKLSMSEAQQAAIFGDGSSAVYVEIEAAGKIYPRQAFQAVPLALRVPVDNDTLVFSPDTSKLAVARIDMDQVTGLAAALDEKMNAAAATSISPGTIANTDIAATAAIDASKIANGSVSSTEFQYLDGVTSSVQTQLDAKAPTASPTFTGALLSALGSAAAPSYSFTADPDTGVWSSGADTVNVSTAGSERLRVTSTGNVGIGTTSPTGLLDVNGMLTVRSGGNVGIGTTAPTAKLDIDNSATAGTAAIAINAASGQAAQVLLKRAGSTVSGFTNQSSDNSLRINNNGADHLTISSAGNVGIGTTSPGRKLSVAGVVESTTGGFIFPDGTTQTTAGSAAGLIACPSGFTMIGTAGKRGTFCIDNTERTAAAWVASKQTCINLDLAEGAAAMCDHNQWYRACLAGTATGMTGNYEWVADWSNDSYGAQVGDSTCSSIGAPQQATAVFRCCVE